MILRKLDLEGKRHGSFTGFSVWQSEVRMLSRSLGSVE